MRRDTDVKKSLVPHVVEWITGFNSVVIILVHPYEHSFFYLYSIFLFMMLFSLSRTRQANQSMAWARSLMCVAMALRSGLSLTAD